MRVTIGERLGMKPVANRPLPIEHPVEYVEPLQMEVEGPVISLINSPSSSLIPVEVDRRIDDGGPPRVRGEMVWLHKTAPTLVIEGRQDLSPEEHAAGRRR